MYVLMVPRVSKEGHLCADGTESDLKRVCMCWWYREWLKEGMYVPMVPRVTQRGYVCAAGT